MPKFWIGIAAIAFATALSAAAYAAAPQKGGGGGGGGGAHVSGGGHVGGGAAHTGSGARGAGAAHVSATGGIPFVCSAKRSGQLYAFDSPQRWQPTCDYPQCHNQHGWQQSADKPDRHPQQNSNRNIQHQAELNRQSQHRARDVELPVASKN